MADLNAGIIEQGQYTTNPVAPPNFGAIMQQAAQTRQTQQQTALEGTQMQGLQLQNAIQAQAYKDQQIMAASMSQSFAAGKQSASQPAGDGTVPVGGRNDVNQGWTVDPKTDNYIDGNGNPVSHQDGPMFSPSGRPNMFNRDFIEQTGQRALAAGASPASVFAWQAGQIQKGQDFDTKQADLYSKVQDIQKAQSDIQKQQDEHLKAVTDLVGNQVDTGFNAVGSDPVAKTGAAQQLLNDMPKYWIPKLQQAGVKIQRDPQTGMLVADTQNPAFLGTFEAARQASPNYQKSVELANQTTTAQAGAASSHASAAATNLSTAQDLVYQNQGAAAQNPLVKQALGLTGDTTHDAPILAQAAAASKARQAATAATASQVDTGQKVGAQIDKTTQAITAQQYAVQQNQRALTLIDKLTARGEKGGVGLSVFGDINNKMGNDPDYAELKELLKQQGLRTTLEALSQGPAGGGAARSLAPLYDVVGKGGTELNNMPLSTLRQQLMEANNIANQNIDLQRQSLARTNAQGAALPQPMTGQAPAPAGAPAAGKIGNLDDVRAFAKKNKLSFDDAYSYLVSHGAKIQ